MEEGQQVAQHEEREEKVRSQQSFGTGKETEEGRQRCSQQQAGLKWGEEGQREDWFKLRILIKCICLWSKQCIRAESLESLSDMTSPPYNIPMSGADLANMNNSNQMMNNNSAFANNNNNNNNNSSSLQIKSDYDLTSL